MILVLDASAAIEIALKKKSAPAFSKAISASDIVMAPDIFPSEITNSFWKYAQHTNMGTEECETAIDCCIDLVDDFVSTKLFCREVFLESLRLKHPSYDLFYLSVARRNNALLLSKDKKLIALAKSVGVKTIQEAI